MRAVSAIRSWWTAERAYGTAGMFIIALPIIVGGFGFGFESARGTLFREFIQRRADLAVQTALAANTTTDPATNKIIVDDIKAKADAYTNYTNNTAGKRAAGALSCSAGAVSGQVALPKCMGMATIYKLNWSDVNQCALPSTARYSLRYAITETIPATFLRMVGIQYVTLTPFAAEALIRPHDC